MPSVEQRGISDGGIQINNVMNTDVPLHAYMI